MAFLVDELLAEQEVVVKGLGPRVRRIRNLSGATILPSGRIALVLNAANLIRTALGQARGAAAGPGRRRGGPRGQEAPAGRATTRSPPAPWRRASSRPPATT